MNFKAGSLIFVVAVLVTGIATANQSTSKNIKGNKQESSAIIPTIDGKKVGLLHDSKKSAVKSFQWSNLPHKTGKTFAVKNQNLPSQKSGQGLLVRRQFIPNLVRKYQFLQQQYLNQPNDDRQSQAFYSNEETGSERSGPCSAQPCHNDGACMRKKRGFYCSCAPGYIGTHCETRKECDPDTCKNGGTCTEESMGRHLCTCAVGFRGENCEAVSKCHPNPCRNGGECSETEESYNCLCKEGYKGKNCEDINQCDPNPCKNAGTCFEQDGDFYCNCPSMYRGKTCEVISECSTARCINGGTCRDSNTGFGCKCPYGFYGKRCEVTACQPNPCLNGGVCSLFGNQHICRCSHGYSGKHCEGRRIVNRKLLIEQFTAHAHKAFV
ncbi:delta-like protein D isoform X2 [Actinia tenebrosa]|uniref:Delta-like protein D isoform X2 n=1 Tax=Actinia tenebrosa TaxID=6105 RepID=A0A6P8ISI6_ACTTE|nr:delta-like protein D isoform X2 [Actinia tenebrosa]